jgi:hypothetical protein
MGALDAKARATCLRLVRKLGTKGTLTVYADGVENPATRQITRASTNYPDIPMAFQTLEERDTTGSLIRRYEEAILLPAAALPAGVEPRKGDLVVLGIGARRIDYVRATRQTLPISFDLGLVA